MSYSSKDKWEFLRLDHKSVSTMIKAGGTPRRTIPEYWNKGTIPFVKIKDITSSDKCLVKTDENITKLGLQNSSAWLVPENSILYSMYASYGEPVINKIPVATNQAIIAIRPSKRIELDFLYYSLKNIKFELYKYIRETTQKNLNAQIVKSLNIPVPPLVEQRGIVEVLGTVDDCIRLTDAVIERAEELKRGLMQQLLTRGIGHTEYKETPLGKIPKTWKIEKYNEICDKITVGIVVKPAQYYTESGVPCLRSLNILEDHIIPSNLVYISEESNTLLKKSKVKKGDIVTIRTGKPGASAVIDDDFDGCNIIDLIISKPKKEVNPHYLSKYLNSFLSKKQILSMQAGAVQVHLNVGTIKQIKVILPPFKEQLKIMDILQIQDKRINIENQKKENLNLLKQGLMQLLLSGKIRVELKGDGLHRIGDGREANN